MRRIHTHRRRTGALVAGTTIVVAVAAATLPMLGHAARTAIPRNETPPTVSGTVQEGSTLTVDPGTWTGSPTFRYAWLRCDLTGGSCASISGATGKTYALKSVDTDNTLRVRVTATNADGTSSATTVPTAVVKATPKPAPTGCPAGNGAVKVSDVSLPARLLIDRFQVQPSVVHRSSRDVSIQTHVVDTCGQSVVGALVYASAVPFDQFSIEDEQQTDANGMATITMHQLKGFPADRNQELLVMFLRARKTGENELTGISTRRLVSTSVDLRS
jgi:hypothetical protein